MAYVSEEAEVSFGKDDIIVRKYVNGITGGKVLNTEGYSEPFIKAGQVVVKNTETEVYKPLGITNGAYISLPSGYEYAGIVVSTVKTDEPLVGIITAGEVNDKALPYPIDSIKTAIAAALPALYFNHD